MILNSYELSGTLNRCTFKRDKNLLLQEEKDDVYEKSRAIKTLIKKYLKEKASRALTKTDKEEISEELEAVFGDLDYATKETAKLHALDAKRQIVRYVWSETRKPAAYFPKAGMIQLSDDLSVKVSPDLVFTYGDIIEVVKLKTSKPKVKQSGRTRDKSANNNLELFAQVKYARQYVKPGFKARIRASFYYLRRNDDSNDNSGEWETQDFFDTAGGNNIVYLEEEYTAPSSGEIVTELDKHFAPLVEEFVNGDVKEECDIEDCKTCNFFRSCQYKNHPIALEKEPTKRSIRELDLSDEQSEVINYRKGVLRVNAGPGAGKTLVVALRIAMMLDEGIDPKKILMLTFTNAGAEEMRQRVALYNEDLGNDADVEELVCTTFNSFGDTLIKEHYLELGYTEEPRLIDEVEKGEIIEALLDENYIDGLDYKNFDSTMPNCRGALAVCAQCFGIIKTHDLSSGDEANLRRLASTSFIRNDLAYTQILELFAKYEEKLFEENLYDYADQEKVVFRLCRKDPYFIENLGFEHIIVDECQDSNEEQFDLLKLLIDTKNFKSLMCVGDDSQAIYGFRGCSPEYLINFFEVLGVEGDDIYLVENHRSVPEVVDFANKINELNKFKVMKTLKATRASKGEPVHCSAFWSKTDEYSYIVDKIKELTESGKFKYEEIAFEAGSKDELLAMADLLTQEGIPSVLLNPEMYMENSLVLAALDLVKAIDQPSATQEILTYLNALSKNTLLEKDNEEIQDAITAFQKELYGLGAMPEEAKLAKIKEMLEKIDEDDEVYESFIEKLSFRKSTRAIIDYCKDFEKYGQKEAIRRTRDYPGVILVTAHSSKGLEWPCVFVSVSKFHSRDIPFNGQRNIDKTEEKRRLLFVAATRARDVLYITGQSIAYGSKKEGYTFNRFLKESMDVLGMEFSTVNPHEEEKKKQKEEEKRLKAEEKAEKEKEKTEAKAS